VLLRQAVALLEQRGYRPAQADITVICEAPRLASHAPAIGAAVAEAIGCAAGSVGLKAKSNEGMGFIGRGEGLAVMVVVTVEAR
jgi:2-C-methyl-D-erythritol 2,4-cyclodiphosphate synthase